MYNFSYVNVLSIFYRINQEEISEIATYTKINHMFTRSGVLVRSDMYYTVHLHAVYSLTVVSSAATVPVERRRGKAAGKEKNKIFHHKSFLMQMPSKFIICVRLSYIHATIHLLPSTATRRTQTGEDSLLPAQPLAPPVEAAVFCLMLLEDLTALVPVEAAAHTNSMPVPEEQ
jgi:hypothetical protein